MDKTTRTAYSFGPAEAGSLALLCRWRVDAERVASGLYRSPKCLGRAVLGIIRDTCLTSLQRDGDGANARHSLEGFGSTRYAVLAAQPLDRIDGSRQSGSRSGLRFAYTGYDLLEVSGLCRVLCDGTPARGFIDVLPWDRHLGLRPHAIPFILYIHMTEVDGLQTGFGEIIGEDGRRLSPCSFARRRISR